ncbi:MAG: DUF1385 domain-containing protein [Clostridia bacterium]|nr:DUF1385 domain-containing protein [Clostridia bacterium]
MSKHQYAAVGGQAVMEGIMMKSPLRSVLAVRTPDGEIVTEEMQAKSVRERVKFLRIPILRGCVAFVESLVVGYKSLMRSAELSGLEEETNGNKWVSGLVMVLSLVLGIALAVGLFMFLPQWIGSLLPQTIRENMEWVRILLEGIIRIALFICYVLATSLMKDIKDLYRYHGAEHKTIFAVEAGKELTVENIRGMSRLHPRCGTSFIFLVFLFSILFFSLLHAFILPLIFPHGVEGILRLGIHLLCLPLVAGCTFELQQWTGRHTNLLTRIIAAPGKLMQKITTAEPTDAQIEVAVVAVNAALTNENGEVDYSIAFKKKEK